MSRHISDIDKEVRSLCGWADASELRLLVLSMLDGMQGVSTKCASENHDRIAGLGMELATWKRSIV